MSMRQENGSKRQVSSRRGVINFWSIPGGAVAQLGARLDGIEEVVGSNPIGSTKKRQFFRNAKTIPSKLQS
jgi:hypothetical protein